MPMPSTWPISCSTTLNSRPLRSMLAMSAESNCMMPWYGKSLAGAKRIRPGLAENAVHAVDRHRAGGDKNVVDRLPTIRRVRQVATMITCHRAAACWKIACWLAVRPLMLSVI